MGTIRTRRQFLGDFSRGALTAAVAAEDGGRGIASALTGPVARGEGATFLRQLDALRQAAPDKIDLAVALARETLRQVAHGEGASVAHEVLAATLAGLSDSVSGLPASPGDTASADAPQPLASDLASFTK